MTYLIIPLYYRFYTYAIKIQLLNIFYLAIEISMYTKNATEYKLSINKSDIVKPLW